MANHCNNHIEIYGLSQVSKSEIINFFDTYENFNYMTDWVESFIKPEFQLDGDDRSYKYGSKWFDFYISEELDDDELIIGGDSAWSPMIGLCQALSNQYKCEVSLEYEEPGMDFAGTIEFSSGDIVTNLETTYLRHRYEREGFDSLMSEFDCTGYTFDDALIRIKESNIRLNKDELKKLKELLDGNQ